MSKVSPYLCCYRCHRILAGADQTERPVIYNVEISHRDFGEQTQPTLRERIVCGECLHDEIADYLKYDSYTKHMDIQAM